MSYETPALRQASPPVLYGGPLAEQRIAARYTAEIIASRLFPTRTARVRKFDYFALATILIHLFELGAAWERRKGDRP